ncbi:MAG: hypothetical protein V3U96_07040 [Paracoccaceae bacterium]
MGRFKQAWRRRPVIMSGFVLALVFACLFAFRSVAFMIYWSDPSHQNQTIQGWMTPRYIAHSWRVPPKVVRQALQLDAMPQRRQSLTQIADQKDIPLEVLIDQIIAAAISHRTRDQ